MRIGHHGYEIQLYRRRENWLWVVFDDDGDETRSGHAADHTMALAQARRAVARLRSPFTAWLQQLLPFPANHA